MMLMETETGVEHIPGGKSEGGSIAKGPCPYPFLDEVLHNPKVKEWWKRQKDFFERLSPDKLAEKFCDHGARAEVLNGCCLRLDINGAPSVTVSFSRAAMVYGWFVSA